MKQIEIDFDNSLPQYIKSSEEVLNILLPPFQKSTIYHKNNEDTKKVFITLTKGSTLDYLLYQSSGSLDIEYEIKLMQDASLTMYTMTSTDEKVSLTPKIVLQEKGASINVISVFLASKENSTICDCYIYHDASFTTSKIQSYVIALDDASVTVKNNTVIKKGSIKSNANQIAKGLNIGSKNSIVADPNLYIEEHDVIAHHGAAIGSINKDDLFYLMSRGLSETDASKIIVMGFIQPLIDGIEDELTKIEIKEDFEQKLK